MNAIANGLLEARRNGQSLQEYPGDIPQDMASGYQIQDAIQSRLGVAPVGWKVAGVAPDLRERFGTERIVGPIQPGTLQFVEGKESVKVPVCDGGFAAVEAEFAFLIGKTLRASEGPFDFETAIGAIDKMHISMEIAHSIVADLLALGPAATVSDHGCNGGAVIGPEIENWRETAGDVVTQTTVNGTEVGTGPKAPVPGSPLDALLFLANNLSARGRDLQKGVYVLTGMTTGVHNVKPGDKATVLFDGIGEINIEINASPKI